jgi:hypothetical protein
MERPTECKSWSTKKMIVVNPNYVPLLNRWPQSVTRLPKWEFVVLIARNGESRLFNTFAVG